MKNKSIVALGLATALTSSLIACGQQPIKTETTQTIDNQIDETTEVTNIEEQVAVTGYNYEANIDRMIPLRDNWCKDYEACGLLVTQGYVLGDNTKNFSVVLYDTTNDMYYRDAYLCHETMTEGITAECDVPCGFRGSAVLVPEGTYELHIEAEGMSSFSYQDTLTVTKGADGYKNQQYQFQYVIADTDEHLNNNKDNLLSDRVKNMGSVVTPLTADDKYAYEDPITKLVYMYEDGTLDITDKNDASRVEMMQHTIGVTTWEEYHVSKDIIEKADNIMDEVKDTWEVER